MSVRLSSYSASFVNANLLESGGGPKRELQKKKIKEK
jgi:hypothetical protein